MASGARLLNFTTDYKVFFSEDNPELSAFNEMQNKFSKTDNILIVVEPTDGDVFTESVLNALKDITRASWLLPYSTRVDSLTNYQHTYSVDDELIVTDLVANTDKYSDAEIASIKNIALNEVSLVNNLVSMNGSVSAVNVTINFPAGDMSELMGRLVTNVRGLVDEIQLNHPSVKVHLTGLVMLNNAFSEAVDHDLKFLNPIMFLIVLFVLFITLKSISCVIGSLLVVLGSILGAMGLAGWIGIQLTPSSGVAPVIILTLALANCVHILTSFRSNYSLVNDKTQALRESLRVNYEPIFITNFTTSIGFFTLNFSESPPFHDLGNIVIIGVGLSFFLSLVFLPALILLLPYRHIKDSSFESKIMPHLGLFVVGNRGILFFIVFLVVIVLALFIPNNELNDDFINYFDSSILFRQASDFTNNNLTGMYVVEYSLESGEENGINQPVYLKNIKNLANWLRTQPKVKHVTVFSDVVQRLNMNMHDDDPYWYKLPEDKNTAAQYLLMYELSLPYRFDLANQLSFDKSSTRLLVSYDYVTSREIILNEKKIQNWISTNMPELVTKGTGPSVMFSYIGERNAISMMQGSIFALVVISFILVFALRSIKLGLISLVPNLIPAVMSFGVWGIINAQIGLSVSVVIGITLGIVVDDTVHFLSKYKRARTEMSMSADNAVCYAFASVGRALITTSIALAAGFSVLMFSDFSLNSDMGLLTAITIIFALLTDFFLLPVLLMRFDSSRPVIVK
ncbi:MAG: MMPL family transporter [Gammaproteobacteria bacterium]|nr:MMPL family transporter [Gammaproteobacteria bacterium]